MVILHGVEVRRCKNCGKEEVAIPNVAGLHMGIAARIVLRNSAIAPEELRFLRRYLGRSSKDFAKILGYEPETLSRWENARLEIPKVVDRLVRLLVLRTAPDTDYSADMLAEIRDTAPKHPRISLRRRGNAWIAAA